MTRKNEEMFDIMWRRAAVCTDVEACILIDSAIVRAHESTISFQNAGVDFPRR